MQSHGYEHIVIKSPSLMSASQHAGLYSVAEQLHLTAADRLCR